MTTSVTARVACAAVAALFTGFAAVQVNDPDAPVWIAAYAVPAALWGRAAAGRLEPPWVAAAPAAAYAGLSAWWWPWPPAGSWLSSEPARESAGLAIAAVSLAALAVAGARRRRLRSGPAGPLT